MSLLSRLMNNLFPPSQEKAEGTSISSARLLFSFYQRVKTGPKGSYQWYLTTTRTYNAQYTLFAIFNSDIGKDIIFKGGTALSKCYKMIDRFSEDIDLVTLRREGETDSKMKSKLKAVSNVVQTILPEVFIDGITNKMGMNRKTAHSYNKEFKGDYGQVRAVPLPRNHWCIGGIVAYFGAEYPLCKASRKTKSRLAIFEVHPR